MSWINVIIITEQEDEKWIPTLKSYYFWCILFLKFNFIHINIQEFKGKKASKYQKWPIKFLIYMFPTFLVCIFCCICTQIDTQPHSTDRNALNSFYFYLTQVCLIYYLSHSTYSLAASLIFLNKAGGWITGQRLVGFKQTEGMQFVLLICSRILASCHIWHKQKMSTVTEPADGWIQMQQLY